MKQYSSKSIVLLLVAGLVLLVASSIHFAPPAFGWVIIAAILFVFTTGMLKYRRLNQHIISEEQSLAQVKSSGFDSAQGSGTVAERVRKVKELSARGVTVDARVFSELLSARESVGLGRSAGGIVVLLGLAGTFYGLMVAIANAGNSLDTQNAGTTIDAIQAIFQSMKGIFGTSFAGLIAALFLNLTHSILSSRKMAFMADMEEYTQFELIPAFAPKSEDRESERRNALVEQLGRVVESIQTGLGDQNRKSLEALQGALVLATNDLSKRLEQAVEKSLSASSIAQEKAQETALAQWRSLFDAQAKLQTDQSKSLEMANQQMLERLAKSSHELIEGIGKTATQASLSQVESFQGRWTEFIQQSAKAVESLNAVAERISQKANDQALSLADSVGERIEQLSREVQASFSQLAQVSSELVTAQKALLAEVEGRMQLERDLVSGLNQGVGEAGTLMRVNQSEFQASLEMFRQGIEAILEKFTGNSAEQENQRTFIDQLQATLEAFSEKASEVLVENAMRTQEILLDVLEQSRINSANESGN